MLKSYVWGGGGVGWVAHEILVSAQGPLVLGFWVWGFGVWGLGLTIAFSVGTYNFPFYTGDLEVVSTFFFAGNV